MMHYSASVLCDAGASAPRNSLTAPPQNNTPTPPTPTPPSPNETPYLLPLLCGMHTNRETGEGIQSLWSPPWPKPSNAPLTESQIMGLINI